MLNISMFMRSLLLLGALCAFVPAQSKAPAATKTKHGQASCDGALEIVPNRAMTFARKRRPGKPAAPNAPAVKADPPARKPAGTPAKQ